LNNRHSKTKNQHAKALGKLGNIVAETLFRHVSQSGQTLGNISEKHHMFLNLVGNIFASREANFVSATMFPRVGKQGNI
jgi:hypothetical protein